MFRIGSPEYFFLLLFIPVVICLWLKNSRKIFIKYSVADKVIKNTSKHFLFNTVVNILILLLVVLALVDFQRVKTITNSTQKGINIVIALDTSGSMAALDFHKNGKTFNRLNALKYVVKEFINKRESDKIALIVFGKEAFTQCPLTVDHDTLQMFVDRLEIGMAGDSTAIGSALILSIKRLKKVKGKSKIVILVTDGRNNAGDIDPVTVAKLASEMGIKIYTIGIGSKGKPVPIPQRTIFGVRKIYVNVDLDDYTLKQIAKLSGGLYFNAENFDSLEKIIEKIDKLEKTKFKIHKYYETTHYYYFFIWLALMLLVLEILYFKGKGEILP
jgi:Ca-activated chloride channel family protein